MNAPTEQQFTAKYFQYRRQGWRPDRACGLATRWFSMARKARLAEARPMPEVTPEMRAEIVRLQQMLISQVGS